MRRGFLVRLGTRKALASLVLAVIASAAGAEGLAQKVNDTVNAGAQTAAKAVVAVPAYLMKPHLDGLSRNTKNLQVQLLYLTKHNLKLVAERRCEPYVDLVEASARYASELKAAIDRGVAAKCFVSLTTYDKLPLHLKTYWESRRARVVNNTKCAKYAAWSDEIVYGNFSDSEKDLALKNLFLDAEEKQCLTR